MLKKKWFYANPVHFFFLEHQLYSNPDSHRAQPSTSYSISQIKSFQEAVLSFLSIRVCVLTLAVTVKEYNGYRDQEVEMYIQI